MYEESVINNGYSIWMQDVIDMCIVMCVTTSYVYSTTQLCIRSDSNGELLYVYDPPTNIIAHAPETQ